MKTACESAQLGAALTLMVLPALCEEMSVGMSGGELMHMRDSAAVRVKAVLIDVEVPYHSA